MHSIKKLSLRDDLSVWEPLLAPLLRPCLQKIKHGCLFEEGDWYAWVIAEKRSWFHRGDRPEAILLSRVIGWLTDSDESCLMLNVVSIGVTRAKGFDAVSIGSLLLDHAITEAVEAGLHGVTLTTPSEGKYHKFIDELLAAHQGWRLRQGKIVAHLSRCQQTYQLLQRLEHVAERSCRSEGWTIDSYPTDLAAMKSRIDRSRANGWGIPWDPSDQGCDWSPAWEFSRVVRSGDEIVGWLICHYVQPDLLRYGKLWMDPGWETSGAPLALLAQLIRQAHFPHHNNSNEFGFGASHPGIHRGCFISHSNNTKLNRLMVNKFKPVADSWVQIDQRYFYFKSQAKL